MKLNFLEIIPTVLLFLALGFVMCMFFNISQSITEQERVYNELKDNGVKHHKRLLELKKEHDSLLDIRDSLNKELQAIRNPHN